MFLFFFYLFRIIDALNAFDGGHRQVLGPKGTAGIWATYPKPFLSIANGLADQVFSFFDFFFFALRLNQNFNHPILLLKIT